MWLVYLYVPSPTAVSSNSDMTVSRHHKYTLEAEYDDTCMNTFAVDICI